ncbi:NAD(P)H-binding protein [Herbiconiux sp. L3-i23]|uniref:NmrA family NAD(P)-binding protein n=1 Tax=Herbiconiux sp. L3-i23 TaxID=2905871 RepID=UPI0020481ACE|nr:NAD(P)H-binding protein [Herbiconiux sp. L3-i23]BDI24057.1 NmrA family transcriptional regulator [Herbiconiux sp. L3-i23]
MRLAVTTPTGNVGSRVIRLLVQAGARPLALMRDPSRLDADLAPFVDAVAVDQADADAVVAATRGVEALYWVDPTTDHDDPLDGYAAMTRSVERAVLENGIARVVFQSSVGAEKRHGAGEIDGLALTEVALERTTASVTHLRCGYFFTNLLMSIDSLREGVIMTTLPPDRPQAWVAPRDIEDIAAARLLDQNWAGTTTQGVLGPADLTYTEVAEILTETTGRAIEAVQISDDEFRAGLLSVGMTPAQADGFVGMSAGLRDDFTPENARDALSTTPTTLAEWAWATLRPAL